MTYIPYIVLYFRMFIIISLMFADVSPIYSPIIFLYVITSVVPIFLAYASKSQTARKLGREHKKITPYLSGPYTNSRSTSRLETLRSLGKLGAQAAG